MKLSRALYLDPKKINANDEYKDAIKQFSVLITNYYRDLPVDQVPIGVLADYTNCLRRFMLRNGKLFDVFNDKIKQLLEENPQMINDMPFY